MAEFKDVIKQQKRMCDAMENCGQCPLIDADCACRFSCMIEGDFDSAETEMIEHIVMDWAEKNPERRYPTWNAWLVSMGLADVYGGAGTYRLEINSRGFETIPADIAEKLGIKPVGGVNDENA